MEEEMYGIDKALQRIDPVYLAFTLNVTPATIKRWRRKDPAGAFKLAIEKAGGQTKMSKILGVSQKTVSNWLRADLPPAPYEPGNAVEVAVVAAGGQPKMAAALGVTQQCVSRWCKAGFVPAGRAQEIEMQFGVPRVDLINPKLRNALGTGGEL